MHRKVREGRRDCTLVLNTQIFTSLSFNYGLWSYGSKVFLRSSLVRGQRGGGDNQHFTPSNNYDGESKLVVSPPVLHWKEV